MRHPLLFNTISTSAFLPLMNAKPVTPPPPLQKRQDSVVPFEPLYPYGFESDRDQTCDTSTSIRTNMSPSTNSGPGFSKLDDLRAHISAPPEPSWPVYSDYSQRTCKQIALSGGANIASYVVDAASFTVDAVSTKTKITWRFDHYVVGMVLYDGYQIVDSTGARPNTENLWTCFWKFEPGRKYHFQVLFATEPWNNGPSKVGDKQTGWVAVWTTYPY